MKLAYCMLNVKDAASAVAELAMPWSIVLGLVSMAMAALSCLCNFGMAPLMAALSIFGLATILVAISAVAGSMAEIVMSITGHTEVELEQRRLA